MKDTEKFITRIVCEPQVKSLEKGVYNIVDKILVARQEKVNESITSQLRDLMKEKGITELFTIDESKVLQLVKEHKALEIIKELFDFDFAWRFPNNQAMLMIINKKTKEYWEIPITKDNCFLLKEVFEQNGKTSEDAGS